MVKPKQFEDISVGSWFLSLALVSPVQSRHPSVTLTGSDIQVSPSQGRTSKCHPHRVGHPSVTLTGSDIQVSPSQDRSPHPPPPTSCLRRRLDVNPVNQRFPPDKSKQKPRATDRVVLTEDVERDGRREVDVPQLRVT